MKSTADWRFPGTIVRAAALLLATIAVPLAPLSAQAPAAKGKPWAVPRTPDGKPDLQGNWTNETQTPLERMGKQGTTLTNDEAVGNRGARAAGGGASRQGQRPQSAGPAEGRRAVPAVGARRTDVHRAHRRSRRRRGWRLQRLLARSRQSR